MDGLQQPPKQQNEQKQQIPWKKFKDNLLWTTYSSSLK